MIQSGGFDFLDLMNPADAMYKIANKVKDLSNKNSLDKINKIIKTADFYRKLMPDFKNLFATGIFLTNNEINDIIKVIKSSKNRGILLKETTRTITSKEGEFLNFRRPLMTAGLQLIKYVLTPLAKSVLRSLELTAASYVAIQKKIFGSGTTALKISNKK